MIYHLRQHLGVDPLLFDLLLLLLSPLLVVLDFNLIYSALPPLLAPSSMLVAVFSWVFTSYNPHAFPDSRCRGASGRGEA